MKKTFILLTVFLSLLFLLPIQSIAQIKEIKKKAKQNQEKKTSSPKSNSTSTKKSSTNTSTSKSEDTEDYDYLYDDYSYESEGSYNSSSEIYLLDGCLSPSIPVPKKSIKPYVPRHDWLGIDSTFESVDFRFLFNLGYHPSSERYFIYANYLPGIRFNLHFIILDFRLNLLTEYTDDYPDSFSSVEALLLFNLVPLEEFRLVLGTGMHYEGFTKTEFHEYYMGMRFLFGNFKDYIDTDIRFSVDYKTGAFPFFEYRLRFNKLILSTKKLRGHIVLGPVYQNYYASHDIWSMEAGVTLNIH